MSAMGSHVANCHMSAELRVAVRPALSCPSAIGEDRIVLQGAQPGPGSHYRLHAGTDGGATFLRNVRTTNLYPLHIVGGQRDLFICLS